MAELPFFSSQSSEYEQFQILTDQDDGMLPSSPLPNRTTASSQKNDRPRKPPTVTPKRFTKFFTPRISSSHGGLRHSKAGRALRDITNNRQNHQTEPQFLSSPGSVLDDQIETSRPVKRRKRSIDFCSSPPQSSPLKRVQTSGQVEFDHHLLSPSYQSDENEPSNLTEGIQLLPPRIHRPCRPGSTYRILHRSFGGQMATGRGWKGHDHCAGWRSKTADFVTTPVDLHAFSQSALPFCTTSCHTNSLVAIGGEEGFIRLVDSASHTDFTRAYISFKPHNNALMDLSFSSDDRLIATACGDQTSRIIDMHTQRTICILSGHMSSVKQVRFHPGNDSTLTTSSRDGTVMIWDTRYGRQGPVQCLRSATTKCPDSVSLDAHVMYARQIIDVGASFRGSQSLVAGFPKYHESPGVSITSIHHLPQGREHLLLATSEVSASIKLWDLRKTTRRNGRNAPLSSTSPPHTHQRTRNYGINAMFLSSDGGRLYTSCRDSTIYAYSTNHLVLGSAPEASTPSSKARVPTASETGIGPLYGFRHPEFRAASFYVKGAIRLRNKDRDEMIAVGSSDCYPVLFPTDERDLPRLIPDETGSDFDLPSLPSSGSSKTGMQAGIPIYDHGTALVHAHGKEVTSMAWTYDGDLVTVSDDFTARCWREDAMKARELRSSGVNSSERWRCGWAACDGVWDEEEG